MFSSSTSGSSVVCMAVTCNDSLSSTNTLKPVPQNSSQHVFKGVSFTLKANSVCFRGFLPCSKQTKEWQRGILCNWFYQAGAAASRKPTPASLEQRVHDVTQETFTQHLSWSLCMCVQDSPVAVSSECNQCFSEVVHSKNKICTMLIVFNNVILIIIIHHLIHNVILYLY